MTPEEKWGFLTRGIKRGDPLILMQYITFFKDAILAKDKELTALRAEVEKEKDHSKFLEKLLEAIVGPGWNKLTIYDAEKMQIAGKEG